MEVLYVLIPLGVLVALASGIAFWAAAQGGQFDDLEAHGRSALADDDAR
ncbi:cytochrome oxidase maturation protein, cbb3-type [Betaproteobacteria bacterium GR16-43]|nr:cytochrome oxidase maturation protein, cbb3-type [Betaproteobacteria bacterium GR16-43]